MQISRALLRQGLEDLVQLPINAFSATDFLLESPRFIRDFSTMEDNRIYLSLMPLSPPKQPLPSGCIVFLPYFEGFVSYNINIIQLPEGISPEEVMNRIIGIFDRWGRFRDDLTQLVERKQPVDVMLSRCGQELENPVYLHNHQYEFLAGSEPMSIARPERMSQMIRTLSADPTYRQVKNAPDYFSIPATFTEYPFLCWNSWSDKNHYDYRVVLAGTRRPLTAADESVFRLSCGYIQRAMRLPSEQKRLFSDNDNIQQLREIFADALRSNTLDYLRLAQELAPYGWLAEHELCVLAVQTPQGDPEMHPFALLRQQLEQRFPHGVTVSKGSQILVIVNMSQNKQTLEQLLHGAVYFLRDNFLKIGISNPIRQLDRLQLGCLQAQIALEYLTSGNSYAWRIRFQDMALEYILSNCSGQLSPMAVCSPKLLQLRQYDTEHNTELYQTLRCYIDCHFNALEATRKLFIHRSTFLYRLERAKSLFLIDLEDPDELLYIMISIRLLEREPLGGLISTPRAQNPG